MKKQRVAVPIPLDMLEDAQKEADERGTSRSAILEGRFESLRSSTVSVELPIDQIHVDNSLNPREGALEQDAVMEYSQHLSELPPMTVFQIGEQYTLVGGFHRLAAHKLAGAETGWFIVKAGDRAAAEEYADLDNLKHGIQLSRREKRQVIERQLKRYPERSDVWLAKDCHTTDKTVRSVREALEAASEIPIRETLIGTDGIERPRSIKRSKPEPAQAQPLPMWLKEDTEEEPPTSPAPASPPPHPTDTEWLPVEGQEDEAAASYGDAPPFRADIEREATPQPKPKSTTPPPPPPPPPAASPVDKLGTTWRLAVTIGPSGQCLLTLDSDGEIGPVNDTRSFNYMVSGLLSMLETHIPADQYEKLKEAK